MHVLVTGVAGFIGFHTARALLAAGHTVVGVDSLNEYYDVALKNARLALLLPCEAFRFIHMDLADDAAMDALLAGQKFSHVVHLAAQAGVRYSIDNPRAYGRANLTGFLNILELCRQGGVRHLVYASSSSVYGLNTLMPFAEQHTVDHPVSLYAASKKSNELMAHSYSHLYRLPTTGLRFFTVYGPWGRPDMALFLFTKAILSGTPIKVFNHGAMRRDFTYIDDIVGGILRVLSKIPEPDPVWSGDAPNPATSPAPYRIYNIGNGQAESLERFIDVLEKALSRKALRENLPMQPGDVPATWADTRSLQAAVGYHPTTGIEDGIPRFVAWYRDFYKV